MPEALQATIIILPFDLRITGDAIILLTLFSSKNIKFTPLISFFKEPSHLTFPFADKTNILPLLVPIIISMWPSLSISEIVAELRIAPPALNSHFFIIFPGGLPIKSITSLDHNRDNIPISTTLYFIIYILYKCFESILIKLIS